MDWREYLFSFEGRAPRWEYWLFVGIGFCYGVVVTFAILPLVEDRTITPASWGAANLLVRLPLFWPGLAIAVRRLHDRGKGSEWAWLFIGFPLATSILSLMLMGMDDFPIVFQILFGLSVVASFWGQIELGILRGTVGDNRYGLDPLPPVEIREDGRKVHVETPGGHRVSLAVTGADGVVRKDYYYVAESDPERARVLVRNAEGARDADVAIVGTILHQTIETLGLKPGTFIPAPRAKA